MAVKAFYTALVFSFLLGAGRGYGQDTLVRVWQVRVAPLNLLDPATGVLQVGVEKRVSRRFALALDYGLQTNRLLFNSRTRERKGFRYYKAKGEVKYFFSDKPANLSRISSPYLSLQGFYFPQHYRKDSSWLITGGKSYRYGYSDIDRTVTAWSILAGDEEKRGRVVIDYYFGIGVRRLAIRHHAVGAVEAYRSGPKDWWDFSPVDYYEGHFTRLHMALGFKLGYILSK